MLGVSEKQLKIESRTLPFVLLIIVILAGIYLRIVLMFNQALFVDEASNVPLSVMYVQALGKGTNGFATLFLDPVKPIFYEFIYGAFIYVLNGFQLPHILHLTYMNYLPIKYTYYARFGALFVNILALLYFIRRIFHSNRYYALIFTIFYMFNVPLIFDTSLVLTSSLVIPFELLFFSSVINNETYSRKHLAFSGIIFGVLVSIQYYTIFFAFIPLVYFLIVNRKFISILEGSRSFLFVIGVAILTFFLLNPIFIFRFKQAITDTIAATGVVLSTSSGVVGIPVHILGATTYSVPIYYLLIALFFQTSIVELFFAVFGTIYLVSKHIKNQNRTDETENPSTKLSFVALLIIPMFIAVYSYFNHLRGLTLVLFVPIALIASYGFFMSCKAFTNIFQKHKISAHRGKIRDSQSLTRRISLLLTVLIVILMFTASYTNLNQGPDYGNPILKVSGFTSAGMYGAWNSAQADKNVGIYVEQHNFKNVTIITSALTPMVIEYAPSNNYIQMWGKLNVTQLSKQFNGSYIVVDEWYAQLWGNPIQEYSSDFSVVYKSEVPGGYSILARIR